MSQGLSDLFAKCAAISRFNIAFKRRRLSPLDSPRTFGTAKCMEDAVAVALNSPGYYAQLSRMSGASIRSYWRRLLLTNTAPADNAWAAIIMSISPIGCPVLIS